MTEAIFETISNQHRCANCGLRKGQHGSHDNPIRAFACPGTTWPNYPRSINDVKRALEVYDQRVAKFWNERSTSFVPSR